MERRQLLGLIGSALLFIGAFLPIVSVPIAGSINYFNNGKGDGIFLIGLAVVSLVLVLMKKFAGLWATALVSLGLIAYTFINLQSRLAAGADTGGRLGRALVDAIQIQWGWAVLLIAVVLLFVAAASKPKNVADPVTVPASA